MLSVSNKITAWKIVHLSFTWNNPGECQMQNDFWNLGIYCCFILSVTSVNSSDIIVQVPPTEGNWHPIKTPSLQSWLEICYSAALCLSPDKRWSESWLLPARQDSLLVSLFLPVANPSSGVIRPPMSSSFLSQQALLALAFVPCKRSPAKSLCDELPSVLCCCSISISHPCGSALPPLSAPAPWVLLAEQSLWRARGPGQRDAAGPEVVDAACEWVMLCSTCRFAALQVCRCDLVLGRLDTCAWLRRGYLPASHHCLLELIAGKGWWCFWREMDLAFSLISSCLWWSSQGLFWAGAYTHTHA